MSENENLSDKLQSLLDAHEELRDFRRIHASEIKHTTKQTKHNEFVIEESGPDPAEMARLHGAFSQAKNEYEAATRKDEREHIKALIDEREPQ